LRGVTIRAAIFYYSATGNTRLACQYIARNLRSVDVDLVDITKDAAPDLHEYDLVGFATFTDFWGPPFLMQKFVEGLQQQDKPAFLFATHGGNLSNLLKTFAKWVSARGFLVVGGYGLRVPESFPPSVARGMTSEDAPNEKEMAEFDEFIAGLNRMIDAHVNGGKEFPRGKVEVGLLASIAPAIGRTQAKKNMGEKFLDQALCNECGICEKACPYRAITLSPKPVFDESKCYGCWACFNRCPTKAIYTAKLRGKGHYTGPSDELRRKLGAR